jgi:hypothetical protein
MSFKANVPEANKIFDDNPYQIPECSCNRFHRVLQQDDEDVSDFLTISTDVA